MQLEYNTLEPVYGKNYKQGYIGFGYAGNRFISKGIAHFTRLHRLGDVKVSHAFIVSGRDECIEARIKGGVQRNSLTQYFDNPEYQIFFRKPRDLTVDIANAIIAAAETQLGTKYDTALFFSQAVNGSWLGTILKRAFGSKPDKMLSALMNNDNRWICSELAAYALDQQPQYHDKGILKDPHETIDPQELFEDTEIFTPWKMAEESNG
jgi:hypothetical protein